jgi:hypothetical protein
MTDDTEGATTKITFSVVIRLLKKDSGCLGTQPPSFHLQSFVFKFLSFCFLTLNMLTHVFRRMIQKSLSPPLRMHKRCITSSQLTVQKTTDPSRFESRPKKEDLKFGTTMADHMLTIEFDKENGWGAPKIIPYQNLSISPAASSLHYGRFPRREHVYGQ